MNPHIPFVVLTRFSVLTEGAEFQMIDNRWSRILAWLPSRVKSQFDKTKPKTLMEKARFLFSEPRMHMRFALFEEITLKSLSAQRDRSFHHVVFFSSLMPEPWVDRLSRLADAFYFDLVPLEPDEMIGRACLRYLRALLENRFRGSDTFITARLDDDDALSIDFINATRERLRALPRCSVISFPNGYTLTCGGSGFPCLQDASVPFNSVGLAYFSDLSDVATVINLGNHTSPYRKRQTTLFPDAGMYLRCLHSHNDSRARSPRPSRSRYRPVDMVRIASGRFGVDLPRLQCIVSSPGKSL